MTRKSTFVKGSSTFICSCCGHNTRWTGEQSVGSKTCPICWDLAGLENVEQDGQMTDNYISEINSLFNELKTRSEDEYQRALKSFDLIAHYVTTEKEQTMTTFTLIDLANLTVKFAKDDVEFAHLAEETDLLAVGTQHDLEEANLTGPQAVALYNITAKELNTGLQEVKRFADKASASKRLWANLVDLAEQRARLGRVEASAKNKPLKTVDGGKAVVANKSRDSAAPAKASDYPAPAPKARRGTGVNLAPLKKAYACRAGSKQAILVDMLSREQGATMPELLEALSGGATAWKEVSVKSGLNWDMNKIKGYGIRTDKRGEEDCYFLVLPEGLTAPIPHTVAASKKGA